MRKILFILAALLCLGVQSVSAQEPEKPDPIEIAGKEADRLLEFLELNSHQAFYVDSILQYNLKHMYDELERLQKGGMQNYNSYKSVQDKWVDKSCEAFKEIFTEDQYYKYMVSIGKGKDLKAARKAAEKKRKAEEKAARRK